MLFTGKLKFLEAYMSACVQCGREQEHIKVTPFQTAWRKCFSLPVLKSLSTEGKKEKRGKVEEVRCRAVTSTSV